MDQQFVPIPNLAVADSKTDALLAAQSLGALLRQAQEYETFLSALKTLNSDLTIQKMAAEIRSHQTALKWSREDESQHVAELTRLQLEMEDQPIAKEYHRAEEEVSALFHAVDEIISNEAGVAFAANAQRSGCGCGG